jgi:hypothetical protein
MARDCRAGRICGEDMEELRGMDRNGEELSEGDVER